MFWRLFTVISAIFFILWQASVYFDALLDNRQRQIALREVTERAYDLLGEALKTYAADLRIAAKGQHLTDLAIGDGKARDDVVRDFAIIVSEKPFIAQLRFLDDRGNEIVRVDRLNGNVVITPPSELQNKADRYYFKESIGLPDNGLYVSALDLNIEHGEIEVPWKPMLRLATPVPRADGMTVGVVVVNIAADNIIDDIERTQSSWGDAIQLLNEKGYWLSGAPRDQLWGFMFGRDTTMAKTAPGVWQRIATAAKGAFDEAKVHYVFETLRPLSFLESGTSAVAVRTSETAWKIVGVVPDVTLADLWRFDHLPTAVGGLLVIAVICLGWSQTAVARLHAEETRRKTQSELVRVERLASLGSLVAGVAHELNTPIGNAVTVASTLAGQVSRLDAEVASGQIRRSTLDAFVKDLREGTEIMLRGLERAAELVRHFKQVAVDQTSERRREFLLADFIRDVVSSVQPQFKHAASTLGTEIASKASLDSYPGPLGQVLINLVTNARLHAFDEGEPGKVMIAARDLSPREVEISVRDTGKGIPPELIERIFEPFFTTQMGKGGSGLGLSIAFNIVTNVLGGTIRAESAPGTGTAVILRIPVKAPNGPNTRFGRTYDVKQPGR